MNAQPAIIASECAAGLHPQNSLTGFKHCLNAGVDGIEFDVHLCAAGEVVVQHDYRLNRNITRSAAGNWLEGPTPALVDLTLAEIRQFDIGRYRPGSREADSYPDYSPRDGERIPTLDEFLAAVHQTGASRAELWIELKTSPFDRAISSDPEKLLEAVIQKLTDSGLQSQAVLLAFEWDLLVAASTLCPEIRTNFLSLAPRRMQNLYPDRSPLDFDALYGVFSPTEFPSLPAAVAAAGGTWWGPYVHDIDSQDVLAAHSAGVRVNAWGVDATDSAIAAALELNADAITVARPDLAMRIRGSS